MNVEFLASKVDDYDCVNCFFKIIDIDGVNKLKPFMSLNTGEQAQPFKMPIWLSDSSHSAGPTGQQESILKVKNKFIPGNDYVKGGLYTINIEFILYNMTVDNESFKGYYAKIQTLKKIESLMGIEMKENNKDNNVN